MRPSRHRPGARRSRWSRSRSSAPATGSCATGRDRRDRHPHRRQHQGLLAATRKRPADAVHRRRLRPHRRRRLSRRGRLSVHRRPQEGDHHPRRREHLRGRGRGRMLRLPGGGRGGVFGAPDERLGEVPVAVIHLKDGEQLERGELRAFLDGTAGRFKIPERDHLRRRSRCRGSAPARSTAGRSRPSTRIEARPPDIADRRRRGRRADRRLLRCGRGISRATSPSGAASRRSAISSRSRATGGSRSPCRRSRPARASGPRCRRSSPTSWARRGRRSRSSRRRSPATTPIRWPAKAGSTARHAPRWSDGECASPPARPRCARSNGRCARPPAVARAMLVGAAADRWNVDPAECETADGFVINGVRTFTFGELAEEAADRIPAAIRRSCGRRPSAAADGPAAAAPRRPGKGGRQLAFRRRRAASRNAVRIASGLRRPAAGSGLSTRRDRVSAGRSACRRARRLDRGRRRQLVGGGAGAQGRGRRNSPACAPPSDVRALFDEALAKRRRAARFRRGDYDGVTRRAPGRSRRHIIVAPIAASRARAADARRRGSTSGRLEVWAATQAPRLARRAAAQPRTSASSTCLLSHGGGRAVGPRAGSGCDSLSPIELARAVAAPGAGHAVAKRQPEPRPARARRARPDDGAARRRRDHRGLGDAGRDSRRHGFGARPAARSEGRRQARRERRWTARSRLIPFPTCAIEAVRADLPFTAGYMRGSPQREFAFFTESFIDELAHAAGMEPLSFRMSMLGGERAAGALPPGRRPARQLGRGGAGQHDGHRRRLGVRVAHRPRRERQHRRGPAGEGPPARRRRRLRPRGQQRPGRAAGRRAG